MLRALILSIALASVLAPEVAGAHNRSWQVDVIADYKGDGVFAGRVSSPRKACQARREVAIYSPAGHAWGRGTANEAGRWRIEASDPPPQEYTAIVFKQKLQAGAGHRHVCKTGSDPAPVPS